MGRLRDKVPKKTKATNEWASKGCILEDAIGHAASVGTSLEEGGTLHGKDVEDGRGTEKLIVGGSGNLQAHNLHQHSVTVSATSHCITVLQIYATFG